MSDFYLNYEQAGRGEPMLLLHGTGSYLRVWDPVAPRLANHYDVVAVDLPGFGESKDSAEEMRSIDSVVDAMEALLDHLGWTDAHLVGNSVGGWLALELAKRGRARSVVALSPCGLWTSEPPAWVTSCTRTSIRVSHLLKPVGPLVMNSAFFRTLLLAQAYGRPWAIPGDVALSQVRNMRDSPGLDYAYQALAGPRFRGGHSISVPVTVAFGKRDWALLPHHRRRDQLPKQTQWVRVPRCGHVPMNDDPDAIVAVIRRGARVDDAVAVS